MLFTPIIVHHSRYLMKYRLLVHHNEESFKKIPEGKRKDMLLQNAKARNRSSSLAHIIHEHFYCNRRCAAATSLAASFARPVGGLAPRDLDVLFQVRLGLSGLHSPVSPGVLAVSLRTVMNNVG